jgi:hypothetical protein
VISIDKRRGLAQIMGDNMAEKGLRWVIPHPGTSEWLNCDSFEEAMSKWFEGFNLPRLIIDGKLESFNDSYKRVNDFIKSK